MFEWDDSKRDANLAKHNLDFVVVAELFDGRAMLNVESSRGEEMRFRSVCKWSGLHVTVVWTFRDEVRRIISLRRARDDEKRAYQALFGD